MDQGARIRKNIKYAVAGELLLAALKFISRRRVRPMPAALT